MKKNYYDILGVSKNATKKEISKAFKKLSLQWHPDKWINGTEEEKKNAEEKFKEINEANSILSDDKKRKNYDMFGSENIDNMFSQYANADDFFSNFRQHVVVKGRDKQVKVTVSLNEIYNGGTKKISYTVDEICPDCQGSGMSEKSIKNTCPHCNGLGKIRNISQNAFTTFIQESTCPHCSGNGYTISNPCEKCGGSGLHKVVKDIEINIPIGIFDNATIGYEGMGNAIQNGYNGDLIIIFKEEKHPIFDRHNDNIHSDLDVNICDALCGTEAIVDCIDGTKAKFKIPKLTDDGRVFKFANKGLKNIRNNNLRGDHIVTIRYIYPQNLTEEQEKLLKEFNEIEKNKNSNE